MGLRGKEKNDYTSKLLLQKFKEFNINISFCFGGRILNGELLEVYKIITGFVDNKANFKN